MHDPTWPEVALLLILIAVSLVLFWRSFGPVVRTIRESKADPGWKRGALGSRFQTFIWEVLLQGKVIRERPLPGIAHAFVFWGFLAFALITIDHFARGFGLPIISSETPFGRVYFGFVALFALLVTVAMAGLTFRRFVLRPRWLAPITGESGVIAALIIILMVTYLAAWGWLPDGTPAARANWWVHTLALLVFLPLIPTTKHLHLMISPVTVFLRRGSFSRIPPLEGDEDFGIETGKDITNLVALQVYSCVECGRCTEHCPANNTGKILNPKSIALGLRRYLRENGPNAARPIVGDYIPEEMLWQCTTCGACEYQCPVGIEHVPIIVGLRRGLVNTGKWEDEYGEKLFLALEKYGNALGFSSNERDKFIQKHSLPIFDGTQDYCLWLGCMGSYDPAGREIILALVEVLDRLGMTYGVLRKERCTGDPVRRLGNDLLLESLAEFNHQQMQSAKIVRMLSICPHCVRTMTEDWKEFGIDVQVEHHSEFLARNLARLPDGKRDEGIVYHDPCYLGRYRSVYDEPRKVVDRTGRVVEPARTRQDGFCCGAGGGLMFLGEEKGKRVNVERADQLMATGAPVVGAACPFCNSMFRAAFSDKPAAPQLFDIAQIAAASLEKSALKQPEV